MTRPGRDEAAEYYFRYIDRVPEADVLAVLAAQKDEALASWRKVSEEDSGRRYEEGKWSARQVLSHVSDCERVFALRALWFARGLDAPMPSFDQDVCIESAGADDVPWSRHLADFEAVREATLTLFGNMPAAAWSRRGVASGHEVTVRALAYIIAGHVAHHRAVLAERYGIQ
jgi:hypothetical protein